MHLLSTCLLTCLLLHGGQGVSMLHIPETTQLDIQYPSPLIVQCSAYLDDLSALLMMKDEETAAVVVNRQPFFELIYEDFRTKVSVSKSNADGNEHIANGNEHVTDGNEHIADGTASTPGGTANTTDGYHTPRNVTITIYSAYPEETDAGVYKCLLGKNNFTFEVNLVGSLPNISLTSEGVNVTRLLFYMRTEYPMVQTVYQATLNIRDEGDVKLIATASGYADNVSWYQKEDDTNSWLKTGQQDYMELERDTLEVQQAYIELERDTLEVQQAYIELERDTLDSASYLVSAVNQYGSYNASVIVIRGYPPSPAYTEMSFRPVNGESVDHTCWFHAEPPADVSYWKQNAETLEWEVIASPGQSLFIPSVELERDVGIYQCVGTNLFGDDSATIYIRGDPLNAWITVVETLSTFAIINLYAQGSTDISYEINMTTVDEESQTVTRILVGETTYREGSSAKHLQLGQLQPESLYRLNGYVTDVFGSYQFPETNFTTEARDPMLYIPETTLLIVRYPNPFKVNCSAYIDGAGIFTMRKDGSAIAVVNITDENTITDTVVPLFATKVSVDDSFASDYSPPRNITVTYFFAEPTQADAGMYQCELGEDEVQLEVRVFGPPVDIMITSGGSGGATVERLLSFDMEEHPIVETVYEVAVNVRDEGSVKLTATVSGYSDSAVSWYKKEDDTNSWLETGQQDYVELEIETVDVQQTYIELERDTLESASYLVSAVNAYDAYNVTIIVIAGYPPSLAYTEMSFRPVNGESINHTCEFDASPLANVSYWKQNAETLEWEVIASPEESLSIPSVELERDVGIYQCVGTNILGNDSATIFIRGDPSNAWITVVETNSTFAVIDLHARGPTDLNYNITMTTIEESQTVTWTLVGETTNRDRTIIKQSLELERLQPESLYSLNGYVMNAFGSYQLQEKNFTTEAVPTTTNEPSIVTSRVQTQPDASTSPSSITTTFSRQDLTTSINQVEEQVDIAEGQGLPSQYASPSILSSWVLITFTTIFLLI